MSTQFNGANSRCPGPILISPAGVPLAVRLAPTIVEVELNDEDVFDDDKARRDAISSFENIFVFNRQTRCSCQWLRQGLSEAPPSSCPGSSAAGGVVTRLKSGIILHSLASLRPSRAHRLTLQCTCRVVLGVGLDYPVDSFLKAISNLLSSACADPSKTKGGKEQRASSVLDTSPPPIQSGCACRGDSGLAHIACLVQAATSPAGAAPRKRRMGIVPDVQAMLHGGDADGAGGGVVVAGRGSGGGEHLTA